MRCLPQSRTNQASEAVDTCLGEFSVTKEQGSTRDMHADDIREMSNSFVTSGQDLGARLRARRKAIGKTMQQVADEASLTIGFISQIERGI